MLEEITLERKNREEEQRGILHCGRVLGMYLLKFWGMCPG